MAAMQFWGIEVKGKEPSKVKLEEGHVIHLSQAALGEQKKDGEPVTLHVKVDGKKLVLGILSPENNPQLFFDLVFEKDFEISHNWKNGSVHFLGYQSEMPEEDLLLPAAASTDEFYSSDEDEDEGVPIPQKENGEAAAAAVKALAAAKPKKYNKPKPEAKSEDEDEDSDDDESDEDMLDVSDDSDDEEGSEDDDESSEEEEPAKAAESGKRKKAEAKTPEPKKAKVATPQKTDGKKGGHTATPHPSKKGGKTPGGDKSTPKSGGVSCGSCKKSFNSEVALQSHSKAKHSGK